MKYLLDTHTFLWGLQSPGKLSALSREIVTNPDDELYLSIATPWELAIKTKIGKLKAAPILSRFAELISSKAYNMLETRPEHVINAGLLPLHHRDPFDRLLIAQSLDYRIPVVSRDDKLDLYGVTRIWK
jgi:PIN domain nuclease of toxin-antitoxin system